MYPDSASPPINASAPKAIDHVVDVEAVARALALAHAGKRAVEGVAQPVQRQTNNHAEECEAVVASQGIADSGANLRRETNAR